MAANWDLRSKVVGSIPVMPAIFQPQIAKNQIGTLSQGNSDLAVTINFYGGTLRKVLITY